MYSWILSQLSSQNKLGNLSQGLMIGQGAREKLAKRTPINYVYWSYFRINRVKTFIVNLKSLEPLEASTVSLLA
jgi:hypothetical protein